MAVEQQWPDVLAMILADMVYRDRASGKFFVLGTYSTIAARVFPCNHPSIMVYLSLTDGRGETPLNLRLVDVDESRPPVFETESVVNFVDPTDVIEMVLVEHDVLLPQPGEYRLQLSGAGQFLRERRLWVLPTEEVELE